MIDHKIEKEKSKRAKIELIILLKINELIENSL